MNRSRACGRIGTSNDNRPDAVILYVITLAMHSFEDAIVEMFVTGTPSVLADHLDSNQHPAATEVRYLTNPLKALHYCAKYVGEPLFIFDLPIDENEKLNIVLRHTKLDDLLLFNLACDYAEHVLPIFEEWNSNDNRPSILIDSMRSWSIKNSNDDELRNARLELTNYRSRQKIRNIPSGPKNVVSTVLIATNPWAWAKHCVAAYNAADTALLAQRTAGNEEFKWQHKHTKRLLTEYAG